MSGDRFTLAEALRRADSRQLREALERSQPVTAAVNGSPPRFFWRGEWQGDTAYQRGDVVYHDGSSWRALADNTGSEPPSMLWEYVARKGATGPQGPAGIGMIGPQGATGATGPAGSGGGVSDYRRIFAMMGG